MEKDLIFFGEVGITDTEANRIADFAKLAYTESEKYLSSVSFVDEKIETIDGALQKDLSFGLKSLDEITKSIDKIGQLKALCAWLREAIAAHNRLLREARCYSYEDFKKDNNIESTTPPSVEAVITEDDVISTFDVKKRNRYYSLEAQAATIGQFIHKDGSIDRARKEYYNRINNPRSTTGQGKDTIIYSYYPSIEGYKIDDMFYSLQQKHATYQKELNSIKSEIKNKISNDEIEKTKAYAEAYNAYITKENGYHNQYTAWKAQETKRVAGLRIIIPNSLKDIYYEVSMQGKKN